MTKPSTILVCPVVPLRQIPPAEQEIVSRFLFQNIRGLDARHDKRWRRLWARLWGADAGEILHLQTVVDRSGPYHRRHMKWEQNLFERQDRYINQDHFRNWLKTGAGWGDYQLVGDRMKFVPRSTAYENCSDDEMREVHEAMVEFLHTDHAQRRLWPQLSPAAREEMVETILPDQQEHEA